MGRNLNAQQSIYPTKIQRNLNIYATSPPCVRVWYRDYCKGFVSLCNHRNTAWELECGSNYTICQVVDYGTKGLIGNTFSNKTSGEVHKLILNTTSGFTRGFIECYIFVYFPGTGMV